MDDGVLDFRVIIRKIKVKTKFTDYFIVTLLEVFENAGISTYFYIIQLSQFIVLTPIEISALGPSRG